ncbi:MAG: NhaA family Na+:H+ antiporter, partial [Myxococcota bacterium]
MSDEDYGDLPDREFANFGFKEADIADVSAATDVAEPEIAAGEIDTSEGDTVGGTAATSEQRTVRTFLQEFSIPLIAGVIAALVVANVDEHLYHWLIHLPLLDWATGSQVTILGHHLTAHFVINDIFMVLFFGVAAKEITEAMLPGGALNPPSKAINPLMGTIGGVVGPAGMYFLLTAVFFAGHADFAVVAHGWGIPTATDIALAWLIARLVFGNGHPAINFLLLLAVADDAIGLGIIAVFYPNPAHPVAPIYLLLVAAGMAVAYGLRRKDVQSWVPYIFLGGGLAWLGLILAHLHPALALVAIVPFMPAPRTDTGIFAGADDVSVREGHDASHHGAGHSPLHNFEHDVKFTVDFGLFFFAFANAGVSLGSVNAVTWIVLGSLIFGKTIGICLFSGVAQKMGFPL